MQRNQIALAVASAIISSTAFAGQGGISVSGVRSYATEVLAASAATQVATPSLAYSLTNPFAANTLPIIKLSLDNGAQFFTACPTLTVNKDSANTAVVIPTSAATGTINATTGVVTCIYQPAAALVNSVPTNATLDFTPATSTIGSLSGLTATTPISGTVAVFDAGGNPANDGNSAILVRAADAFAVTALSSSNLSTPELSQIDLLSNSALKFTNPVGDLTGFTNTINIGVVRISETPGQQFDGQATPVEVTFANMPAGKQLLSLEVTGTFQVNPSTPSLLYLSPNGPCGIGSSISTIPLPAATPTKITFTNINVSTIPVVSGVKTINVCYNVNASFIVPIPASQFVLTGATFNGQTAGAGPGNDVGDRKVGTTNFYNLTLNQSQVDLRQFWSTATSNANGGWVQLVRIINTSNTSAVISGQYIAESTGALVGNPTALNTTALPAGAVLTMTAAQVEAAIGVPPAGIHRLRITAPLASLRVQSFLRDPGGRHTAIADQGAEGTGNAATGNK